MSVIYIIAMAICFFATKGYDTETKSEGKKISFKAMGKNIVTNPNLIGVVLHDILRLIAYYTVAAGTAYYAKVVLGDASASGTILMMFYLGCFVGSFIAARVAKKLGTKNTTIVGVAGWLVIWVIAYVLQPGYVLLNVLLVLSQVFFGLSYGLSANLYSMCATWSHWKTGENTLGTTMSIMTGVGEARRHPARDYPAGVPLACRPMTPQQPSSTLPLSQASSRCTSCCRSGCSLCHLYRSCCCSRSRTPTSRR